MTSNVVGAGVSCQYTVTVNGKGVDDTFYFPCGTQSGAMRYGNTKYALYDNPTQSFSFFTDKDNSLVVIEDGQCTERTYKIANGGVRIKKSSMWSFSCNKIKTKFEAAKSERAKASAGWSLLAAAVQDGQLSKLGA